jgi:hypothetical protein
MSSPTHFKRGLAGIILAAALALAAPLSAQAAPVDLATVGPFVVLGGQGVTNTGPSVLNGDLGVSPGTSLPGFGLPAVINGATHNNDAVAAKAQLDLTNAYNVAAENPVLPANDLTGIDLGGLKLAPGAYRYTSSAQLTGALTLDAEGDPNAQFVFEITEALTTASASSVNLINGASPCNVYWQVGSSATLGSTTAFQGNLMALTSISLNNGVTVLGRVLARNGEISLINDVLTKPLCAGETTGGSGGEGGGGGGGETGTGGPGSGGPGTGTGNSSHESPVTRNPRTRNGTAVVRPAPRATCTAGFRATVSGHNIRRVVFSLDGTRTASRRSSPYTVYVKAGPGAHTVRAHVTFTDATRAKTMTFPYRACAAAVLKPRSGPSQFTG